jgi:hypothetical protein
MKVIDNFLPEQYQNSIEKLLLEANFPWYLNKNTVSEDYVAPYGVINTTEGMQFTHTFFREGHIYSEHYGQISLLNYHLMLKENIDTTNVLRVKANLNVAFADYPDEHHYPIHIDFPKDFLNTTCIYYVNDSDGDTIFFKEDGVTEIKRVTPKKGRLVYFDSNTPHAGCPPKNYKVRSVINFNFKKETK